MEQGGINGDRALLIMDRAVGEMRRGRAIHVVDGSHGVVAAAVEAVHGRLLKRLQAAASGSLTLFITAERARAGGFSAAAVGSPVAVPLTDGTELEELRFLGGLSSGVRAARFNARVNGHSHCGTVAIAGLRIAKAGRLLPALVGFETSESVHDGVLKISVEDVERHLQAVLHSLKRTSQAFVPLDGALQSEIVLFRDEHGLSEHVAVVIGTPDKSSAVPVRLHSACLTGDLLGSLRCDCGEQLRAAVGRIAALGGGVLLYLDQEGRGIGLPNKLRAYALQDAGLDTLDADRHLGFLADERNYDVAAALLRELGIRRVQLLTNNPQKISALREHGIDVAGRLPLVAAANSHNERYLKAKLERAGHLAGEPGG
jgi:GTP cyclohydrolase II